MDNKNRKAGKPGHKIDDEAQNITYGARPGVTDHDRNKATEGIQQGRDKSAKKINRNERNGRSMNRE